MKRAICLAIVAMALVLAGTVPARAERGHGGWHHGGWGWGGPRVHWGGSFYVAPWYPWFPWYPYSPYYYPPYPPAAATEQPPAYAVPDQEASDYWYYCKNPPGYYPYVKRCPGGWMRVVPDATPPR